MSVYRGVRGAKVTQGKKMEERGGNEGDSIGFHKEFRFCTRPGGNGRGIPFVHKFDILKRRPASPRRKQLSLDRLHLWVYVSHRQAQTKTLNIGKKERVVWRGAKAREETKGAVSVIPVPTIP